MMRTLPIEHNEATGPADIAVFSRDRRLILIMEVKDGASEMTPECAAELRHDWIGHGFLPITPFFIIASRFRMFLWRGDAELGALPDYSAPTDPILDAYCPKSIRTFKWPLTSSMTMAMSFWLSSIMHEMRRLSPDSALDRLLLDSGLFEQIKGRELEYDVLL